MPFVTHSEITKSHSRNLFCLFSSVQFSHSVVSDSLQPHGLQHLRPPCPSLEFTQTQVLWVSDAIQPLILSSPYLPTFSLSQHQGLFRWVSSSHQVAKVLEFQLQHQSFQRILMTDFFWDGQVGSPCSPRDFRVSSNRIVQKHQFFGAQLSL